MVLSPFLCFLTLSFSLLFHVSTLGLHGFFWSSDFILYVPLQKISGAYVTPVADLRFSLVFLGRVTALI